VAILTQLLAADASDADARAIAHARADGITAGIRVAHGRLSVLDGADDFLGATAWVFDASGHLVEGTVPPRVITAVRQSVLERREQCLTRGLYLFCIRPFTEQDIHGSVVAAVDLHPFEASERRLLDAVLLLGVLTIALAAGIAAVVASRSLAVVRQMSELADEWQSHDPSRRFSLGPARDEITELGRTLDHMLDRISEALASERRITDEIAHELRTPLAGLRSEAQWGRAHASGTAAETLDAVLTAADRMEASLSTVLDSARARTTEASGCDLVEVVRDLLADDEKLDVSTQPTVNSSRDVVRALLAPVLENSRLHQTARTWVEISETADAVAVHVRDDGPGLASGDTDLAFTPGWSTTGGHGLGLAVVRRLATSHAIAVTAHGGPGGHVELRFPTT
jgi:signal transduction histidine kinase